VFLIDIWFTSTSTSRGNRRGGVTCDDNIFLLFYFIDFFLILKFK